MPENGEAVIIATEAAPSVAPQTAADGDATTRGDAAVVQVSWPVEDPSEYRPEFSPGGKLESLGKKADDFRVYYEVCVEVSHKMAFYYFLHRKVEKNSRR